MSRRGFRAPRLAAALIAGGIVATALSGQASAIEEPQHSAALDDAIIAAAKRHGVPERLVRRIIMRESKYNARARNRAFWGLMQISYPTARSMGFKGTREELLNPFVNLRYAVPYLANAFVIAGRNDEAAVRLYAAGYYFTARSKGLLSALRTADSPPLAGIIDLPPPPVLAANAVAQPPESIGIFGALFGPGRQAPPPVDPAAPAPAAQPTSVADASPVAVSAGDANDGPKSGADMIADASGSLEPPKKWKRDGGVTIVARGEQAIEQLAERADASAPAGKSARARKPHKITLVAALDVPAAAPAQAYAAPGAPVSGVADAPSQAAIAAATSAPAAPEARNASDESAEIPTQYDEPDASPVTAAVIKKTAKKATVATKIADSRRSPESKKAADRSAAHKTRQALAEKDAVVSGRSESH